MARTADLVLMILDATKKDIHKVGYSKLFTSIIATTASRYSAPSLPKLRILNIDKGLKDFKIVWRWIYIRCKKCIFCLTADVFLTFF